jgi:anti-sigma factor RsiW
MEDVSETDIQSYIDDQLDPAGRIRVEAVLARRPDLAAEVMGTLQQRDELRQFLAAGEPAGPATRDLARRLDRRLAVAAGLGRLRRLAAMIALVGVGWAAHEVTGSLLGWEVAAHSAVPAFVEDMIDVYQDQLDGVREAAWLGQAATAPADLGVPAPPPPGATTLQGVRGLSWRGRPAIEVAYRDQDGSLVHLFATRASSATASERPALNRLRDTSYWSVGPYLYAMTGAASPARLVALSRKVAKWLEQQEEFAQP